MYTAGYEKIGDDWIISHHESAPAPTDSIPMNRSEYWAMKEGKNDNSL